LKEKLEWLKKRFGESPVRKAIILVGLENAEQFLIHGGFCPEA
jgi:hypothetical protein